MGGGAMSMRQIVLPALITLAVTILRLTGELQHWSTKWFSPDTGGITPAGVSWIFGITWLAAPFGAYFGIKLMRAGQKPHSWGKAFTFAALGIVIFLTYSVAVRYVCNLLNIDFPEYLIVVWFFWALAGGLQYFAWPDLFKLLLAYAYAARIPVAVIMGFAMLGHWGTHYDYVGIQIPLSGVPRYLWLAFFPQLVGWVGFTVTLGSVAGILATAVSGFRKIPAANKIDRVDLNGAS
jgi:hypothetical protein